MSECVEQKLHRMMCEFFFSMHVDESTFPGNKCLLLVCVRVIVDDTTYEELAFSQLMETHSTVRLCLKNLKIYEVNKIPLKHLIGIATDDAPSMVGKYHEFITYFKELNPKIITNHCVIHRQHLV